MRSEIDELVAASGLSRACVRARIRLGWSRERIACPSLFPTHPRYPYEGEMLRLREIATRARMNSHTLRTRLRRGMTIVEATTRPVQRR